jgi:hypothetical protein
MEVSSTFINMQYMEHDQTKKYNSCSDLGINGPGCGYEQRVRRYIVDVYRISHEASG